mmetsp:Transcript_19870/g.30101  ORF Transcript_19870/g.30101 Transcript_19870/m.30101 type:complete len:361 (-) Transcript_19870:304-1386(-)|eukprot:CAMPEP_0194207704 /NCGR_PEP_ID=MMETSP0156-20130528/6372_1 /TAXON_ID=33649 /ORGANISM="Thalassionema nitzschioides, Strain L26-B" /LENGTH=360 /DNA_ID=CAMNT_0038934523 /DNA_START=112 /DNA_END=1194 /DNA_ORIENTATION=-
MMEKKTPASSADKALSPKKSKNARHLPARYKPGKFDVICGKGKGCFNHEGNKNFRQIVADHLVPYSEANTKLAKSGIVSSIIMMVRELSPGGGFIKRDAETGSWHEVGDHLAREKVGQTMRDALHHRYRSSTKSKKKRRQIEQAKAHASMETISNGNAEISSKIDDLNSKAALTNSDRQLAEMFTKANIEILRELNRLKDQRALGARTELDSLGRKEASSHHQLRCYDIEAFSNLSSPIRPYTLHAFPQFSEPIAFLRSQGLLRSAHKAFADPQQSTPPERKRASSSQNLLQEGSTVDNKACIIYGVNNRSNPVEETNFSSQCLHGNSRKEFVDLQTNYEDDENSGMSDLKPNYSQQGPS